MKIRDLVKNHYFLKHADRERNEKFAEDILMGIEEDLKGFISDKMLKEIMKKLRGEDNE
jgi:hypothetical protein